MAKITLNPITGAYASVTALNARFQQIEDAFNNNVFWRLNVTGEPNSLSNDLDLNNNQLLNIPAPATNTSPARLQDILDASSSLLSTSAVSTSISDSGGYYVSDNVEGALQEAASDLSNISVFSEFRAVNNSVGSPATPYPFSTETFDTNSDYDHTTYRFTPSISGIYQINCYFSIIVSTGGSITLNIRKNGGTIASRGISTTTGTSDSITLQTLVQMNGTTDYIDIGLATGGGSHSVLGSNGNVFEGVLINPTV